MRTAFTFGCVLLGLFLGGRILAADPPGSPATAPKDPAAEREKGPAPDPAGRDLRELNLEHSRLRNELLAVESRLGLLSEKVFGSRLEVRFRGDLERPFSLARLELVLDDAVAYRQEFEHPPSVQAIKLFDAFLPPGQHQVQLHLWARSPGESQGSGGSYFAGSGLLVVMRERSDTRVVFEADQSGDALGKGVLAEPEPEGKWNVEIEATYETQKRE